MFELLANGTVDAIIEKIAKTNIVYGFGGMASLNKGLLPGRMVMKEHYRLKSSGVILSRSFCNIAKMSDLNEIRQLFENGLAEIRKYEQECATATDYEENRTAVKEVVERIVEELC